MKIPFSGPKEHRVERSLIKCIYFAHANITVSAKLCDSPIKVLYSCYFAWEDFRTSFSKGTNKLSNHMMKASYCVFFLVSETALHVVE